MEEKTVKRIYLSGPITAIGIDRAKEIFDRAKEDLTRRGFEVLSPLENGVPCTAPYEEHMAADFEMLKTCDTICMLPGWWQSKGATAEHDMAANLRMNIITYRKIRRRLK